MSATERTAAWEDACLRIFTIREEPRLTRPLLLVAITTGAVAMGIDGVPRYSAPAYYGGLVLAVGLAIVVGNVLARERGRPRLSLSVGLPAAFGAMIGMAVQAIFLGTASAERVRDLGGLVSTDEPGRWILAGAALGLVPAAIVASFLVVAGRFARRRAGADAVTALDVGLGGGTGLVAAVCLNLVTLPAARLPLVLVIAVAELSVALAVLADGARIRFLREIYAGGADLDVVPASHFGGAAEGFTPVVGGLARLRRSFVLVRRPRLGRYRDASGTPLGLVAETAEETLAPVQRRRRAAIGLLVALTLSAGAATLRGLV